jgi:hypothetical protein
MGGRTIRTGGWEVTEISLRMLKTMSMSAMDCCQQLE